MKEWDFSDDIAQVNHKNTKKKEKNGEFFFQEKRGDPIPEYLCNIRYPYTIQSGFLIGYYTISGLNLYKFSW